MLAIGISFQIDLILLKLTPFLDSKSRAVLFNPSFAILISYFWASFGDNFRLFNVFLKAFILFIFLVNNLHLLGSTRPIFIPIWVNLISALSARKHNLYSAREVNIL